MSDEKPSAEKKSGGVLVKVIATVFASIVAPLAVAVGIKYLSPAEKPSPPTAPVVDPNKEKDGNKEAGGTASSQEAFHFNGKDLSGFTPYLYERGRDQDTKGVFTVNDGVLRISGEESGYLATQKPYQNYTLHAEYKWGEKLWPPRESKARFSGIAVHAGSEGLLEVALQGSYLCHLGEGVTGDLSLNPSPLQSCKLTVEADPKVAPPRCQFLPKGPKRTVSGPSAVLAVNREPRKDVKGFRSKNEVEKPRGEWNTLEIVCGLNSIIVRLNGKTMNAGTQANRTKGKILFRSALAEIFFRKIDVIPAEK